MTFRLALQLALQFLLCRNLDDLIVDDAVCKGNIGHETEQIGGDAVAIDWNRQIGLYHCWHVDNVHINQ